MHSRVLSFPFVFVLLAIGAPPPVFAQTADVNRLLPIELANRFADRISLEQSFPLLSEALKSVAAASVDEVEEAAERHAAARRQDLSTSAGNEISSYSIYRDMLRFPELNRGNAVRLNGVCRSVETLKDGTLAGASLVELIPADAPTARVLVVIEAGAKVPRVGDRTEVLAVFTNLILWPAASDKAVPVVIASRLVTEGADANELPDKSLWSVVKDRTLGVRLSESDLYYRLLHEVHGISDTELESVARQHVQARRAAVPRLRNREDFPVFVDMFQNPTAYRGEVVSLQGYAREVRKYPAGANPEGIETLYETWIYTDDSQSNPAVVISTKVSDDLPVGSDLQVPVRAVGFFFKIYGYRAHDTTRVAPMVLAGTVERRPEPQLAGPPWWLYILSAAIFLGLLAWLATSYRNERRRTRIIEDSSPDFSDLSQRLRQPHGSRSQHMSVGSSDSSMNEFRPLKEALDHPTRLVACISGGGTTVLNLQDKILARELDAEIVHVISSRQNCAGVERARAAGLPVSVVERKIFASVAAFSAEVFRLADESRADLVALAGFLSLLEIPDRYRMRVLNVHPSLIPAFCGKGYHGHHVHEAAIARGVKVSGCTVHFADNEYDHGPILVQETVPVLDDDTAESLAARVFEAECRAYPQAIREFAGGRLVVSQGRVLHLRQSSPHDGK